jgi:hypothetical protein
MEIYGKAGFSARRTPGQVKKDTIYEYFRSSIQNAAVVAAVAGQM